MVIFVFRFLLELALTAQAQYVVFQMERNVLPVHTRKFRFHNDFTLCLENIDGGTPVRCRRRLITAPVAASVVEKAIHTVLEQTQITKRIPSHNSHGFKYPPDR